MVARKYALVDSSELNATQKKYVASIRGQAAVVYNEMARNRTPRLAVEINEETKKNLVTTQDFLRVTLYYIIIFKGKGIVRVFEPSRAVIEPSPYDISQS